MKHTLFILGALFAGTFLFAEELDVNGNFMKTSPQDAKQAARMDEVMEQYERHRQCNA